MKKYELAKKQGLNWQALLIEETQTEIKELIKDMILKGKNKFEIGKEIEKKINVCLDELEIERLKEEVERGLRAFADKVYIILFILFANITYKQIQAISNVARGSTTPKDIQTAEQALGQMAYERRVPLNMYSKNYMQMVKERIDTLSRLEAKEDYTSRMTLRNSAEIQVRHEAVEKQLQDLRDKGENLIWIVPHANCSERCQPFQGKLYSLDGTYGTVDGIQYQPLEVATEVYETTKAGKIYKNGCLSGYNCFDEETEVFTNKGWIRFSDLRGDEKFYTLNINNKITEWQNAIHYFKKRHKGSMIELSGYSSNLVVTPDHNMLYSTDRVKQLRFKYAKNINIYDKQYASQEWFSDNKKRFVKIGKTKIEEKLFVRLLGYWLADGSIHGINAIKISQTNNDFMWEQLQGLPCKLWRDNEKIIVRNKDIYKLFCDLGTCQTKYIPEFVKEMPKESLIEFINVFNYTDGYTVEDTYINGYKRKPHKTLFTTNKRLSDDLCEIALKCGYRPKESIVKNKGKEIKFKNGNYKLNYDLYVIHLNHNTQFRYKSIKEIEYDGYVYCVEVPNHTLLVKRKGFIQWCGNCRHRTQPYRQGNKPKTIPAAVIDKERDINNKQRYLERGVRSWRDRALQWKGIDDNEYRYAKAKAVEWNNKYIEFSKKNGVAYYPDRTKII